MSHRFRYQHGQIALITLLVLTIATTVGLSLVARSTTDIALSRNVEESARAFSAAEAGIEEALRTGVAGSGVIAQDSDISYSVTVASLSGAMNVPYVLPKKTLNQETETIWLVNHKADGTLDLAGPRYTNSNITVCWGGGSAVAAIAVTVLYRESSDGSYQVGKRMYDADLARGVARRFDPPTDSVTGCGSGTQYYRVVPFSNLSGSLNPANDTLIALRIRPIYADTQLVIIPLQNLPFQTIRLESVGKTASGATRKIIVYKEYKSPGTIFDAAVYSEGTLVH